MVLLLSLNTSLDRTLVLDDFQSGKVYRARAEHWAAGGKALNVLRMLNQLGKTTRTLLTVGGMTGTAILQLLADENLDSQCIFYDIEGYSRICDVIIETSRNVSTVINTQGPTLSEKELLTVLQGVDTHMNTYKPNYLILTGSLPPGTPTSIYAQLVTKSHENNVRCVVDASGDALLLATQAVPWLVKVNWFEFMQIAPALSTNLGISMDSRNYPWYLRIHPLCEALHRRGTNVVVTNGMEGNAAWTDDGYWRTSSISLAARNATGSGDAFLAGLISNFIDTHDFRKALRWASATGANKALHLKACVDDAQTIEELARNLNQDELFSQTAREN